jgi:hypothetical protein
MKKLAWIGLTTCIVLGSLVVLTAVWDALDTILRMH